MLVAVILLLLAALPAAAQDSPFESPSSQVQEGHWVEVRGVRSPDGIFRAEAAEVFRPQEYDALIGAVEDIDEKAGRFTLLGRRVSIDARTRWRGVSRANLERARVKVEGFYGGPGDFKARIVSSREAGRERVGGTVEDLQRTAQGIQVRILGFTVLMPRNVEHQVRLDTIPISPRQEGPPVFRSNKEDEQFGRGYAITRDVRLSGQLGFETSREDNFDLASRDAEDRVDYDGGARVRLSWLPSRTRGATFELRGTANRRADEKDGISRQHQMHLGQTWLYTEDPFGFGVGLQFGRQDFEDAREWIYDQNLDALRVVASLPRGRLELSTSTVFGNPRDPDQNATNWIARISNTDEDRQLASYVVHRRFRAGAEEHTTHVGISAFGSWLRDHKSWLEAAILRGSRGVTRMTGWGFDLGTTWAPSFLGPLALTGGYALGSGDDAAGEVDHTFRQTGLQDNTARFDGVTSFQYYGELMDPELANLRILTGAIGVRLARRTSLDVVYHGYRQHRAVRNLVDAEVDRRPDGVHRALGREVDFVFGSRPSPILDVEVVLAVFRPGAAFAKRDTAYQSRAQIRYRF